MQIVDYFKKVHFISGEGEESPGKISCSNSISFKERATPEMKMDHYFYSSQSSNLRTKRTSRAQYTYSTIK